MNTILDKDFNTFICVRARCLPCIFSLFHYLAFFFQLLWIILLPSFYAQIYKRAFFLPLLYIQHSEDRTACGYDHEDLQGHSHYLKFFWGGIQNNQLAARTQTCNPSYFVLDLFRNTVMSWAHTLNSLSNSNSLTKSQNVQTSLIGQK